MNIKNPLRALVIGDPHFKKNNLPEMELFSTRIRELALKLKPDIIVCLGDVLDKFGTVDTTVQTTAVHFLGDMEDIAPLYLIIGNHDRRNNSDYLTPVHGFRALKRWKNTSVADTKAVKVRIKDLNMLFVPYVHNGYFTSVIAEVNLVECLVKWQKIMDFDRQTTTSVILKSKKKKKKKSKKKSKTKSDPKPDPKSDHKSDLDPEPEHKPVKDFVQQILNYTNSKLNNSEPELIDFKTYLNNDDELVQFIDKFLKSLNNDQLKSLSKSLNDTKECKRKRKEEKWFLEHITPLILKDKFEEKIKNIDFIFAHQEIRGAKMGAIISVDGDLWDPTWPLTITGHLHDYQTPQKNILYVGTPIQHTYGETGEKTVSLISFWQNEDDKLRWKEEKHDLNLLKRKIIHLKPNELSKFEPPSPEENLKIKIKLRGTISENLIAFKSQLVKDLRKMGVVIISDPVSDPINESEKSTSTSTVGSNAHDFSQSSSKSNSIQKRPPYSKKFLTEVMKQNPNVIKEYQTLFKETTI